jgi:hypothetical protein
MKRTTLLFLAFNLWVSSNQALAYKEATHEDMSEIAAFSSVLAKSGTLAELGMTGTIVDTKLTFPNSEGTSKTIRLLIRDGARFEDALIPPRSLHHFFNPLNGSGLDWGLTQGKPSPDWALEDKGQIDGTLGKQEFSYRDAREYFFRALTGKDAQGNSVAATKAERDKYFGLTFQTLGQVIHHIQDMAQPQHVRNDVHMDIPGTGGGSVIPNLPDLENPSLYESWTNDVRSSLPTNFSQIGYDLGAPKFTTTFNQPRKFWETTTGEGLAQFTNRNFVSAGTNFDNPGMFNFPLYTPALYTDMDIQQMCANAKPACGNPALTGKMRFYGNWVEDRYTGQKSLNPMASTYSLFDADLEKVNAKKTFTLNRFNFEVAHGFLVPRAVAYSAGLINYFFRGKLEFKPDANNPGKYLIRNLGAEDMKGTFTLYYDAKDGKRYPVARDNQSQTWVNRSVAAKGELGNLAFTPPVNPVPKSPGVYMLVFNGDMGEERVVPGATVGALVARVVYVPAAKVVRDYEFAALTHQFEGCTNVMVPEVVSRYLVPESNYNYSGHGAADVCNLAYRVAANGLSCATTEYGKLIWSTWEWTGEFLIYEGDSYFYGNFSAFFYPDMGRYAANNIYCKSSHMEPDGPRIDNNGEYMLGVSGLLLNHRSCPPGYGESNVNYNECVLVDPDLVRREPGSKCTLRWSPTTNTWDKDSLDPNCIGEL